MENNRYAIQLHLITAPPSSRCVDAPSEWHGCRRVEQPERQDKYAAIESGQFEGRTCGLAAPMRDEGCGYPCEFANEDESEQTHELFHADSVSSCSLNEQ